MNPNLRLVQPTTLLKLTQCVVEMEVGEVRWDDGRIVRLTTREMAMLRYLSEHIGEDVSREALHQDVWGHGVHTISRAAADTVRRLRPKIEIDPAQPRHLLTVYGEGYRLAGTLTQTNAPKRPSPLPVEDTPLIGRTLLVARVHKALEEGRLITLTGPGGVGKTRLALRIAHALGAEHFVDASSTRTMETLRDQIASQLRLDEPQDIEELAERMALVSGLIVLDNLEQVSDAAAKILTSWLQRAGEGRIIVTSRARLGLPGERVIAVEPLEEEYGVQLLQQRLRQLGVSKIESSSLVALQQIVEGLPLALELAAARVGGLGIDRVVERLAKDPTRLAAFGHGGPERHQSVRATVQWSWDLLEPVEQQVLAQAAVFRGGVSIHALELALEGQLPADRDIDDSVAILVEHALMKLEKPGRFKLPLAVREVAESTLTNREAALHRHTLGVIGSIKQYWRNNVRALADLDGQKFLTEERENLLCVLERSRGLNEDNWCKSLLCLSGVWHSVGMARRIREEVTLALDACKASPYAPYLLLVLGGALRGIDEQAAVTALQHAEEGLNKVEDQQLRMFCLVEQLMISATREEMTDRAALYDRAEALTQSNPSLCKEIEFCRAWIAFQTDDAEKALTHVQLLEGMELNPVKHFTVQVLGLVTRYKLGQAVATADRFRSASQQALSMGDVFKQAFCLTWAGRAEIRAGQFSAAVDAFRHAETIYRRGGADGWAGYLNQYRKDALAQLNKEL